MWDDLYVMIAHERRGVDYDKWLWKLTPSKEFTVCNVYMAVQLQLPSSHYVISDVAILCLILMTNSYKAYTIKIKHFEIVIFVKC